MIYPREYIREAVDRAQEALGDRECAIRFVADSLGLLSDAEVADCMRPEIAAIDKRRELAALETTA